MKLFNKEKDFVLKIANLVLLIWLIASLSTLHINIVNLAMNKPFKTYEEYKELSCNAYHMGDFSEEDCNDMYLNEKQYSDTSKVSKVKSIVVSIGNAVIVSGVIYFINKGDKDV